jgi:signal transduction histidine kinase/ActR/RegA family two-component response regulator/HAMP domain-containing protein
MAPRSRQIRRSLMTMMLLISGVVVVVSCVAFSAYEFVSARQLALRNLTTLGKVIASNSTGALAFDDPKGALQTLSALKAQPHLVVAGLYTLSGSLFARYGRDPSGQVLPASPPLLGYRFDGQSLVGVQAVVQRGERLGTLYLRSDLGEIYEQVRLDVLIAALILALTAIIAYFVARRLQGEISEPILALAGTARAVSENRDYSVRAPPVGGNELGLLTDAFNHMLTRIEEAQGRLHSQLIRLDLLHRITRAIGERQDLPSIFQVVLRTLEQDLPIDFGCACLYESGTEAVTLATVGAASAAFASALGLADHEVIPIDQNGLSRCVAGQLVYEPDTRPLRFAFPERFAAAGLRSLIIAPLLVENRVFGMLVAARQADHAFTSTDCEFLLQLSQHVALAARQAQLHEALQHAYDDLSQSQQTVLQQERLRALGQMASGIAHDINNAISPVSLYTDTLLEREPNLSERARGFLVTIQRAIEDVAETVARMREFYRPREQQLVLARVDLNQIVEQVVDLTRARWSDLPQQRGVVIRLEKDLLPRLPGVMGAEVEIRDALTNLIFNAVDAMPDGGTLTLRTRVGTAPGEQGKSVPREVEVDICDTGIGMSEETRRRCLEPFYTTKGERGTGLGLAMVYGMVQRHSADLEIVSELGKGTTFRLVFPVSEAIQGDAPPMPAAQMPIQRLSILLVDDDPLILKSLRDILEADGHKVTGTDGGQRGIDAFCAARKAEKPFDVVITDLGMPYVDGRKVAAAIEAVSPETPVVLLTGWGKRLLSEDDIPPHVDRVLSKPPKIQDIRAALAALVSNRPRGA